jgi:hypothetical protein
MPRGRTNRPPQKRKVFLDALAETGMVKTAYERAKISHASIYDWREADPQFAADWDEALERGIDRLEDEAMRRAMHGTPEPVFYQGEECGQIRRYSDTLAIFMLKSRRRHIYGDQQTVEHRGSIEHRIAQMSAEERRARLAELQRKLLEGPLIEGQAEEVEDE